MARDKYIVITCEHCHGPATKNATTGLVAHSCPEGRQAKQQPVPVMAPRYDVDTILQSGTGRRGLYHIVDTTAADVDQPFVVAVVRTATIAAHIARKLNAGRLMVVTPRQDGGQ